MLREVVSLAPTSEAALELGLLMQMLGRGDATMMLERVALLAQRSPDPIEVARGARAERALGRLRDANASFQAASNRLPKDPSINTAWGELFLQTEQNGEALKSFQAAIEADNAWTPALLGAAQALGDDNPPQAVALAKKALEINSSSVDAYVLLAGQATSADKRDEGRELLQKALAINPSSLDAHALLAAMAYVEDKQPEFEAEAAKTLAISPKYGDVFRLAGQLAANNYRFDEAVALTRRALELDPDNAPSLTALGTHLLRTGDEPAARVALDRSFKLHPYSVVTFNLLGMMDKLDTFETIRDGDFIFRMPKDEVPVLREYIIPLAHKAFEEYGRRYNFTPKGPILIEVFNKHDDFAVRNVGLPGMVGALGACFGRVVTMDSPKALPPGSFQWEATLWHELAHVFTIQMSNQRVPRWLTEGVSAFEEKRAKPEWARPNDLEFVTLLNRGETIKLRELNAAFTNPRTISLAYYQGALLVEHMSQVYGDAGVGKLVRAFADGSDSDEALKKALETDFDELQASFDQFTERMFANIKPALKEGPKDEELQDMPLLALRAYAEENPQSFAAQMALGRALRKEEQVDEAVQAFERAAQLVPAGSRREQSARAAGGHRDHPQRQTARDRGTAGARQRGFRQYSGGAPAGRAAARDGRHRSGQAAPGLRAHRRNRSVDAEAHAMLGTIRDAAQRAGHRDARVPRGDRARSGRSGRGDHRPGGELSEERQTRRSQAETLAALEIAPSYERAQALLLELVGSGAPSIDDW